MINKNFDLIDKNDIDSLVVNEVVESRTLEYKEKLPGNTDDDKKEFLADISSFANASGGDILYGIPEKRDSTGKTTGIPAAAKGLSGINSDAEIRRIESIIQDGLEPRIIGSQVKSIDGFADGVVITIRIPKSWNSPHMVVFKKQSRFYSRNSAGKFQLDVGEIRSAFVASESLGERVRQFRRDRIAKILSDDAPVSLKAAPTIVLHSIPLSSFASNTNVDLSRPLDLLPISSKSYSERYNFDGLLKYSDLGDKYSSYIQLFRNGSIEAVNNFLMGFNEGSNIIPCIAFEEGLIQALQNYLKLQMELELNPPFLIMLSLLNVRGYTIAPNRAFIRHNEPIDRDILFVPEISVEDFTSEASTILRPAFDAVWQAAGWSGSRCYDEQGNWTGRPF